MEAEELNKPIEKMLPIKYEWRAMEDILNHQTEIMPRFFLSNLHCCIANAWEQLDEHVMLCWKI